MGDMKQQKKTNIKALKVLIARERQTILEKSNLKGSVLHSPVDL